MQIPQNELWNFFPHFESTWIWSLGMNLTNIFGLVGALVLAQVLDSLQLNYLTAVVLLILSDEFKNVRARARLFPTNPVHVLSEKQFKKEFRFSKADIPRILRCLNWPPFFRLGNRIVFSAEICLLMVLYRFAFPSTLSKVEIMFGRSSSSCSLIISHGISLLYARFGNRLLEFDTELVLQRIHLYKAAITRKSRHAATHCFGLLDGTLHKICRPKVGKRVRALRNKSNIQRAVYNGHKRHHGVKFQSIVLPDGLIAQMFGPVEGRKHDTSLLKFSKLDEKMALLPPGSYVYGDQAYPVRPWLLSPFRGQNKTMEQRKWNRNMRTVRISVEHGFKILTTLWAHLKYVPAQKMFSTAVEKHYVVCTALANMHNCVYPNQVSSHFALSPPTLEEYIGIYHLIN